MQKKAILVRFDIRNNRTSVCAYEVERRRRDDSNRVLKRCQYVKCKTEFVGRRPFTYGDPDRSNVRRPLPIGDLIFQ